MLRLWSAMLIELIAVLTLLRALLWAMTQRPLGLGKRVQIFEEGESMAKVFTYRQGLLTPPAGVASQRLVVTVDGVTQEPITVPASAESIEFRAGPEGASVTLSLDYLDDAGNDSGNVEASFVVTDTIGPAAPDGFGELSQIAEEEV